jgi:hypothetical protein
MPTSMFDDNDNGPALNKSHIVMVVPGLRKDVPEGWTRRRTQWEERPWGKERVVVYTYPDGSEVKR